METMNHPSDKRLPGAGVVFCDTVRRCRSPFILYIAVMLLLGPLGFAFNLMGRGEDLMRLRHFSGRFLRDPDGHLLLSE